MVNANGDPFGVPLLSVIDEELALDFSSLLLGRHDSHFL